MENNWVYNVLLSEVCEMDNLLPWVGRLIVSTDFYHVNEGDVYVNNYFEQVVPKYAAATYRSHFRMTRETMDYVIEELRRLLEDNNVIVNRMVVSLEKKVHITVWMLANYAVTFRECGTLFGLSTGCVHLIFMQICSALSLLRARFIHWPNAERCQEIAESIAARTHFPGVIGALDGCHIEIKAPYRNPFDYFNRKQFHSVILQGTCDPSLRFTDIFVGMPGRMHDARVYRLSPLNRQISLGMIPPHFHILADSAYTLHNNILTPFRNNGHLTRAQVRYNNKHSSIRSCIERAFGLLKNKFRRLRFLDMNLLEEIPVVITASCVLHNIVIMGEGYDDGEDEMDDIDDVPNPEGNEELPQANGQVKRSNIVNAL